MKRPNFRVQFLFLVTLIALVFAPKIYAGEEAIGTVAPTIATQKPVVGASATIKLPYGVDEVLKLSRAKVNDEVILTYVQSSGTVYQLGPKDIVYLRDQGVSDRVVNAMLDEKRKAVETAQTASSSPQDMPDTQPAGPAYAAADPAYAAPVQTEIQAPVSTLYIIPYYSRSYAYRPYTYSYHRPYVGYCGPVRCYAPLASFRRGFANRGHYHSFR